MKKEQPSEEIARRLVEVCGTQDAAADLLGVTQPAISRWINGGEISSSARVLAERVLTEYRVRRRWIEAYLVAAAGDGQVPDLVQAEEIVESARVGAERKARLVDRRIQRSDEGFDLTPRELASEIADAIATGYLAFGFLTSGDFFGFYREEGSGLRLVSFTVNRSRRPRTSIPGLDPIFGG